MPVLALFGARLVAARLRLVAAVAKSVERVPPVLRTLGPYAVIELVLPGGSLLALLLWLFRRHIKANAAS